MAFSKFDLEISRSRSWSKFKVTKWVWHPIDTHLFCSMSTDPPIPEIWLFQNLTLKIQGHDHGWSQSSRSHSGSDILSTHIPLVPCQSAFSFLRYGYFKIWPWKSKVKVIVQGHIVGPTSYGLTSLLIHITLRFLRWLFQNLTLNIQGQDHGWGQSLRSHSRFNILLTHQFRPMSISPAISWDKTISKFDLENPRSSKVKVLVQIDKTNSW